MVPILPIVDELIQKYATYPYCVKNNRLMPVKSNTRYNCYLKEMADICGIKPEHLNNEELNTHKARRTFADMMLNNGVPLEDVSYKSLRTTQKYCRVKKNRISGKC